MNNKGFTLVELIASVAILALLLVIAVPSIGKTSELIRESQRKNVIKRLEIAASRYAFDTGDTLFFVEDLIMFGYMDSDDVKDDIVIDPLTNKSLNCYGLKATKESDYYKAKFLNEEYKTNNACDRNLLLDNNTEIKLEANLNGEPLNNGTWISTKNSCQPDNCYINLKADVNCDPQLKSDRCMWSSTNGAYLIGGNTINYDLGIVNVINLQFSFQRTASDKTVKVNFGIRIDNEEPSINLEDSKANADNTIYTIYANDGVGSGIDGYYLSKESSCTNYSSFVKNNKFSLNGSGKYYICVKDNVGNVSKAEITI